MFIANVLTQYLQCGIVNTLEHKKSWVIYYNRVLLSPDILLEILKIH